MIKKYTNQNLTWVDVENPTKEEVSSLMSEFNLDPENAQEMAMPTYKPKVMSYSNYIYLILHFPAFKHSHNEEHKHEIDFVIGKNFLITTRYTSIDQMDKISKIFEVNTMLEKTSFAGASGVGLFYFVLKELFKSLEDEIDFIGDSLKNIERKVFSGQEKHMVMALSKVSRNLLDFKSTVNSQSDTMADLEKIGIGIFGKEIHYYLSDLTSEHYKIGQMLEKDINLLQELRETNNSLLSTKQSEIMKTLTIITFIVMPFTIINSFFQIYAENTPILGMEYDWYIIVLSELVVVFITFFYARHRKWF
ncbi:MAG: CorA family divalent cation transporter [bacterium]